MNLIFKNKKLISTVMRRYMSTSNKILPNKFSDLFLPNNNYHYVDKTSIIPKLLENNNTDVILRPDLSGKTFNLEILKFFLTSARYLNENIDGNSCLEFFKKTEIYKNKIFFDQHFSKYPIISFNFNELDQNNLRDNIEKFKYMLKTQIQQIYHYNDISHLSEFDVKMLEIFLWRDRTDTVQHLTNEVKE
jgi:hypothetical protein